MVVLFNINPCDLFLFPSIITATLAAALGKELDLPVYYEPVISNGYLDDFYLGNIYRID